MTLPMLAAAWYRAKWLYIFEVWQIPVILLLIALIIFWKAYRNKQM